MQSFLRLHITCFTSISCYSFIFPREKLPRSRSFISHFKETSQIKTDGKYGLVLIIIHLALHFHVAAKGLASVLYNFHSLKQYLFNDYYLLISSAIFLCILHLYLKGTVQQEYSVIMFLLICFMNGEARKGIPASRIADEL